MKPTAPCLGCKDRHGGCWTNCNKYIRFQGENEVYKETVKKTKEDAAMLNGFAMKRWRRSHKIKEAYK